MPLSELQMGLIALGAAAVAGVIAYNKWQERRFRRDAEQALRSDHADVLLGADDAVTRVEPSLPAAEVQAPPLQAVPIPALAAPDAEPLIDCVATLDPAEPVNAASFRQAQAEQLGAVARRLRWYGWNEAGAAWRMLDDEDWPCCKLTGVVQLVDRSGPVNEAQLDALRTGVLALADRYLAVARLPELPELSEKATALDRFCAQVDVQIAVNVVSGERAGIAGTKLRGLAEAAGMVLLDDGLFHALDDAGETIYTLGNLEPVPFARGDMKSLVTHGLTFSLDVPRVREGKAGFDAMLGSARGLAGALGARVVDDKRQELNERSLDFIRGKIEQFQAQMRAQGIEPGGASARRLFS